eukprot:TRINITY_DN10521_c0_g1_i1.p1 TRINITY_DN10521_c0_g1~~TRINITY_DN10521_c0_g1_i1.p1  ORF type:complete len:493 (+),score=57.43 TRINITY_DN10521_c0_g1_i1:437-1915(+)
MKTLNNQTTNLTAFNSELGNGTNRHHRSNTAISESARGFDPHQFLKRETTGGTNGGFLFQADTLENPVNRKFGSLKTQHDASDLLVESHTDMSPQKSLIPDADDGGGGFAGGFGGGFAGFAEFMRIKGQFSNNDMSMIAAPPGAENEGDQANGVNDNDNKEGGSNTNNILDKLDTEDMTKKEEKKQASYGHQDTITQLYLGAKVERNYLAVYLLYPEELRPSMRAVYIFSEKDQEFNEERMLEVNYPENFKPSVVTYLLSKPAGFLFIACQNQLYCYPPPKVKEGSPLKPFKICELPDYITQPTLILYWDWLLACGGSTRDNQPSEHVFVYNLAAIGEASRPNRIQLSCGRKLPLVFHDDERIYVFGGGENKNDKAFKSCDAIDIKNVLDGKEIIIPRVIQLCFLNSTITKTSLIDAAVVATLKGHMIIGRRQKKLIHLKCDENYLYLSYSKAKIEKVWLNSSLVYLRGSSLIYFVFVKGRDSPSRREVLIM